MYRKMGRQFSSPVSEQEEISRAHTPLTTWRPQHLPRHFLLFVVIPLNLPKEISFAHSVISFKSKLGMNLNEVVGNTHIYSQSTAIDEASDTIS